MQLYSVIKKFKYGTIKAMKQSSISKRALITIKEKKVMRLLILIILLKN